MEIIFHLVTGEQGCAEPLICKIFVIFLINILEQIGNNALLRIGERLAFCLSISNYYLLTLLVERQGEGGREEGKERGVGGSKERGSDGCIKQQPPAEWGMEKLLAPT